MGHLPTDVAPDVRSRGFVIEADAMLAAGDEGVLIAHGDATCGYSLFVRDGRLVYDMNVGGAHATTVSDCVVPPGRHRLGVAVLNEPSLRRIITFRKTRLEKTRNRTGCPHRTALSTRFFASTCRGETVLNGTWKKPPMQPAAESGN